MKVVKARHAGACYGVERALDMAYAAISEGEETYTLGPLIHNPQEVKKLSSHGILVAESINDIDKGIVIIRSHGVVPQVKIQAKEKELAVIDATCPHVARAQKAAASLAQDRYNVVIVGESGHPEVEGMRAYAQGADNKVFVVSDAKDLPDDITEPLGIVIQTTQSRKNLDTVVSSLKEKGFDPLVRNTVCFATRQRQEAAAELAEKVDVIIVIGGRNSSNTTRLYEICMQRCERSYHVEVPEEVNPEWFKPDDVVGVTAGASTPEGQIEAIISYLKDLNP